MNIGAIVGIALVSSAIIVLLRKNAPEFAIPVSVVTSLIILTVSIIFGSDIFKKISELVQMSSVSGENIKIIFKALGICYITQIGKDVCKDCGETAIGDKVDLAGKIAVAALSIPIVTQVLEILTEIVNR